MTTPKPETYTAGLGELARAFRKYTGLSQHTFADRLGIREKSLSDIEIGRRDAPRGFIDSCEKVVSLFDKDVDETLAQAEEMAGGDEEKAIHFRVSDDEDDEYIRAVVGRAAVTGDDVIVPVLDTEEHTASRR